MGVSLIVLSFSNSLTFTRLDEPYEISPSPEAMRMSFNLYYVGSNHLEMETRDIAIKDSEFLSGITDELMKGPRNKLLQSPFSTGDEIIGYEVQKSTLFLNFKREFLSESFWNDKNADIYIWSIVNTYTELEDIFKVQFLFDGKKVDKQVGEYNLNEPLVRNDSLMESIMNNPSSRVLEFINYGLIGEYEKGYKLISTDSKEAMDYKSFIIFFDEYMESLNGYKDTFHFYQEVDDQEIVYVKFTSTDLSVQDENKVEKFVVVQEDGQWFIDLVQKIKE